MPKVEIRLLGAPTVLWDGAPLSILRRQTRILLYRLAVPGPRLTRAHLSFLFWPDIPESTAGRNLSHLLTHLRQALPDSNALITSDDQVSLDPEVIWSDVGKFLQLRSLRGGGGHRRMGGDIDKLQRAVQLYRGPFLDGVFASHNADYESWMILERRTLERRYRDTLHTLIEEFYRSREYDQAIRYANRYLETDRLDETVHQRLISIYAERGDRAAALQQYRQCETLIQSELGVQPLPETRALFDSLRVRPTSSIVTPESVPRWSTMPGPRLPMIGRDGPWQELHRVFAQASAGRGMVALVTGEAGVGKSRLLEEFVTRTATPTFVAAGQPGTETLPFHVSTQAIRSRLQEIDPAIGLSNAGLQNVSPIWLAEVVRLLPELADDEQVAARLPADPRWESYEKPQLYEGLCRIVLALTNNARPNLLCIDNLQWADNETLEWLAYLAPCLQCAPLLVLVACRNVNDRLRNLHLGLSRQGLLTEIELGGLQAPEIHQLVHSVLEEEDPESEFIDRVHDAAAGNPFCVIQIVTALVESGLPPSQWTRLEELPAPTLLCTAVGERLDALDAVTRQVVEACAILTPVFGFDLVRLTSGRREMETLDALEKLVTRGFLECTGSDYRFHQDVIQRVLESRMSPMRRQILHRRAGHALEQVNRYAVDALVRHYEAGDEPGKAAHFRKLAAQRAETLFAFQDSEDVIPQHSALKPQ